MRHSVLTRFVTAVAVTIVLARLDALTGYDAEGDNRVLLALERTPLGPLALVVKLRAPGPRPPSARSGGPPARLTPAG